MNAYALMAGRVSALSGVVPQISLVLGQCGGIASAIAGMSDFVIMSKNGSLFVNGPQVVSAVAGKQLDWKPSAARPLPIRSGMAQMTAETDEEAIAMARKIVGVAAGQQPGRSRWSAQGRHQPQSGAVQRIDTVSRMCAKSARGSWTRGIIVEIGEEFAPSMVTAMGHMDGTTVGFIANQPSKDEGRLTVYGCKKAARFASLLRLLLDPIISIVDSTGMKISTAPQGELSRAGAQLMFALTEATPARRADYRAGHRNELRGDGFPRGGRRGVRLAGQRDSPL